jgi:hypothetical protein
MNFPASAGRDDHQLFSSLHTGGLGITDIGMHAPSIFLAATRKTTSALLAAVGPRYAKIFWEWLDCDTPATADLRRAQGELLKLGDAAPSANPPLPDIQPKIPTATCLLGSAGETYGDVLAEVAQSGVIGHRQRLRGLRCSVIPADLGYGRMQAGGYGLHQRPAAQAPVPGGQRDVHAHDAEITRHVADPERHWLRSPVPQVQPPQAHCTAYQSTPRRVPPRGCPEIQRRS